MERCFLTISKRGAARDVEFAALVEEFSFDGGEKDIEGIPLINGGRVRKWSPQSDFTFSLTGYAQLAGTDTGTSAEGFFDLMDDIDASNPMRVPATAADAFSRTLFRVLIMWTNDTTVSSAKNVTTDTFTAMRMGWAEVVFTNVTAEFTGDKILKFTISGKCCPFDKAASPNYLRESCQGSSGTDVLPAVAAYTAAAKFA